MLTCMPSALIHVPARTQFIQNEEFEVKPRAELLDPSLSGWVHHSQAILPQVCVQMNCYATMCIQQYAIIMLTLPDIWVNRAAPSG